MDRVVLAYSGGLDTSVAIRWLDEKYGLDVIALTVDVGNEKDCRPSRPRRSRSAPSRLSWWMPSELFVHYFVFPALQAGAVYEGEYPLATALARPLIAKIMVDVARKENASPSPTAAPARATTRYASTSPSPPWRPTSRSSPRCASGA